MANGNAPDITAPSAEVGSNTNAPNVANTGNANKCIAQGLAAGAVFAGLMFLIFATIAYYTTDPKKSRPYKIGRAHV